MSLSIASLLSANKAIAPQPRRDRALSCIEYLTKLSRSDSAASCRYNTKSCRDNTAKLLHQDSATWCAYLRIPGAFSPQPQLLL
ncbi:MAG: hypothetical protein N2235_05580 [Fischerella sp.]|nr:hypothetical protein [Fischerella sp.]